MFPLLLFTVHLLLSQPKSTNVVLRNSKIYFNLRQRNYCTHCISFRNRFFVSVHVMAFARPNKRYVMLFTYEEHNRGLLRVLRKQ